MSLFTSREDLLQDLLPLLSANKAQAVLVTKAWERMMSSLPSDGTLAASQSSHTSSNSASPPAAESAGGKHAVTNYMLKRFSNECNAFNSVTIYFPHAKSPPPSSADSATINEQRITTGGGLTADERGVSLTFQVPSHGQLYFLRFLISCCLPREDTIGPSTTASTQRLASNLLEVLMALLQLMMPPALVEDVRSFQVEGEIDLWLSSPSPSTKEKTTEKGAGRSSSPRPTQQKSSGLIEESEVPSAQGAGRRDGSGAFAAFQALDILLLPHFMWEKPRPLPLNEVTEKGGGFFGKLWRGATGTIGGNASSTATAASAPQSTSGGGPPSGLTPPSGGKQSDTPLDTTGQFVDMASIINCQRYLLAPEDRPQSFTTGLPISATIGDFFAMALCSKIVPIVINFMSTPTNPISSVAIETSNGSGSSGNNASGYGNSNQVYNGHLSLQAQGSSSPAGAVGGALASAALLQTSQQFDVCNNISTSIVGYSPPQVQPIALLAQAISTICAGVAPAFSTAGAYIGSSVTTPAQGVPSPTPNGASPAQPSTSLSQQGQQVTQGDINYFGVQSLTSMAAVYSATGQRANAPHSFTMSTTPAAYTPQLLSAGVPSYLYTSKTKASGARLDALKVYAHGQAPELRVSDVVAVAALTALSTLHSACIVPVTVVSSAPLVGGGGGAQSSGGQASSGGQSIVAPTVVPVGSADGLTTVRETASVASNAPPALSVALASLQSALASPSQYARSIIKPVRVGGDALEGGSGPSPLSPNADAHNAHMSPSHHVQYSLKLPQAITASIIVTASAGPASSSAETLIGVSSSAATSNNNNSNSNPPPQSSSAKPSIVRTNLLFLVAIFAHRLTTSAVAYGRGGEMSAVASPASLIAFSQREPSSSLATTLSPADLTAQRLLDGLRCVFITAARVLVAHGAARALLVTTAGEREDAALGLTRQFEQQGAAKTAKTSQTQQQSSNGGGGGNAPLHQRTVSTNDAGNRGSAATNTNTLVMQSKTDLEEDFVAVEFQSNLLNALLSIFVNCGPAVRSEPLAASVVKRLVFPMLMETSLRHETPIHRVSFSLYLALRRDFRGPHTVNETGSFFNHVIFFLLESKHAKVAHKRLVLHLLMQVAEEPRDLVEVFLNYDCDKNSNNVFETMVGILGRLTCGTNQPVLPSLTSPTCVRYGIGGVAPDALPPRLGSAGSAATSWIASSFPPVGLPSRCQYESLYDDALAVVMMLPKAVRQWIERFEDSLRLREMDAHKERERRARLSGEEGGGGLAATEEALLLGLGSSSGLDNSTTATLTSPVAGAEGFLEQRKTKRMLASFFDFFNVNEKPNDAIALITSGKIPYDLVESEIAEAIERNFQDLAGRIQVEKLATREDEHHAPHQTTTVDDQAKESTTAAHSERGAPASINYPRLVARFLHAHCDSVDKIVLGEYFSKMGRREETKRVFQEWVALHDFVKIKVEAPDEEEEHDRDTNVSERLSSAMPINPSSLVTDDIALPIDEALRVFLGGFKLLGEAQVVDRTMELFAAYYCDSVRAAVRAVISRWDRAQAKAEASATPAVAEERELEMPTPETPQPLERKVPSEERSGGEEDDDEESTVAGKQDARQTGVLATSVDCMSTLASSSAVGGLSGEGMKPFIEGEGEGGEACATATATAGNASPPLAVEEVTAASKHPLLAEHEQQHIPSTTEARSGEDESAVDAKEPTEGSSLPPSSAAGGEAVSPRTQTPRNAMTEAPDDEENRKGEGDARYPNLYVLNQNTAFILAFSICMLNTDAHSAHVKDKMGQSQFVRNNSGIDDGRDVPSELLAAVFTRVFTKEIVLRPTLRLAPTSPQMVAQLAANKGSGTAPSKSGGLNVFANALIAPLGLVYGAVKLPFDVAGELVFNTSAIEKQRQREREARQEMQTALTAALSQLRVRDGGGGSSTAAPSSSGVAEAGLEHAIPMWESCVDLVVTSLTMALSEECAPTDLDTEHTDSTNAQWLLSVAQDVFAVCVTFGFHEHVSIVASLLKQLSLVIEVIDPSRPLEVKGSSSPPSMPIGSAASASRLSSAALALRGGQRGCVVSRPISIRNLRCAFVLLECVREHRSRVTSVVVWRHCYAILSRLELIDDKLFWAAAEEEVAANAQAQLNASKDSSWLARWRSDVTKAATSVGGLVVPGMGIGDAGRNAMVDISARTIAGISDPIVRSLTVRNAILRAVARVRAEGSTSTSTQQQSMAAGDALDGVMAHPAFFTFVLPRATVPDMTSSPSKKGSTSAGLLRDEEDEDEDEDLFDNKVGFAQQAAMIIAISKEAESELLNENRTHLLQHLASLLGESLTLSPKLQWNELWKRVSASVFMTGATHPLPRVSIDVLVAVMYPIALKFLLQQGSAGGRGLDDISDDKRSSGDHCPEPTSRGTPSPTEEVPSTNSPQRPKSISISSGLGDSSASPSHQGHHASVAYSLFQQDILRPFYTLLTTNRDITVQAAVLDCVNGLVARAHSHIAPSTGWPLVFSIINTSATSAHMIPHGWRLFKSIIQQYPLDALCTVRESGMQIHHHALFSPAPETTAHNNAVGGSSLPPSVSSRIATGGAEGLASDATAQGASSSPSHSSHNKHKQLFDLRVFETGIIYALTSFACQSDETIACEALLWLETCADVAQHGLAVFTATTHSPDKHVLLRQSMGRGASPSPSQFTTNTQINRPSPFDEEGLAMDILMFVPLAPLSFDAPLRLRAGGSNKLGGTTSGQTPTRTQQQGRGFSDSTSMDDTEVASKAPAQPQTPNTEDNAAVAMVRQAIGALTTIAARNSRVPNVWQCIIECIAPVISIHSSLAVRCVAVSCFFSILAKYGHLFDGQLVWDSVVWEACRSALMGHILTQATGRRMVRLAPSTAGRNSSDPGINVSDSQSSSSSSRDVSWSEILTFLILREAVCATLECEGRLITAINPSLFSSLPSFDNRSSVSATPLLSNSASQYSPAAFAASQRVRVGRWRNRLLAIVAERSLGDIKYMRTLADPFANVGRGDGGEDKGGHTSADGDNDEDGFYLTHSGCSFISDIVLNIISTVYLPSYVGGVETQVVANTLAEMITAAAATKEGSSLSTASFHAQSDGRRALSFIANNLRAVSEAIASSSYSSLPHNDEGTSPSTNSKVAMNNTAGGAPSKYLCAMQRPLFVEIFLHQYLSNILPRAFESLQDCGAFGGCASRFSSEGSATQRYFIGPVASHSRSSFLCLAGNERLSALLTVNAASRGRAVVSSESWAAPQASLHTHPDGFNPLLTGMSYYAESMNDRTLEEMMRLAGVNTTFQPKQTIFGLERPQPEDARAGGVPSGSADLRALMSNPVGGSFYKPPPHIAALATVSDAVLGDSVDSSLQTPSATVIDGAFQQQPPVSVSVASTIIATWKDFLSRIVLTSLWRPYWTSAGKAFSAVNSLGPLSNGLASGEPRCLHCRCDCHGRPSHNINCMPFANTMAAMQASGMTFTGSGGKAVTPNPHMLKCCCPCIFSHNDSTYVLTGMAVLQVIESSFHCAAVGSAMERKMTAAKGDGEEDEKGLDGLPLPLLCRHITPPSSVLAGISALTRKLVVFLQGPNQSLSRGGRDAPIMKLATSSNFSVSLYKSLAAQAQGTLVGALSLARCCVHTEGSPLSTDEGRVESGQQPLLTDTLPTLPAGAALVFGTLWSMVVQHRVGLEPIGSAAARGGSSSSCSPPFTVSLLAALTEDLSSAHQNIGVLSRWVVRNVVASAEPPASASIVTATARAAEMAKIRQMSGALSETLFSSQASAPETLFGLWSVADAVGIYSGRNADTSNPRGDEDKEAYVSFHTLLTRRIAARNGQVVLRAALLIALRHVLEAVPSAVYPSESLAPLIPLISSHHEEIALLSSDAARRLRCALANRLSVAVRRQSRSHPVREEATTARVRRWGTRPFRDVGHGVAFYLASHTATGLAADSDDSEADIPDPASTQTLQPQQQSTSEGGSVCLGDVAMSALFGTLNPPINEPRNALAITPPPQRVSAWIRERCGVRSTGEGQSPQAQKGFAKPLLLVRVAASSAVFEDILLHLSSLPMVYVPSSPTEPVVPRLTHTSATLVQHYVRRGMLPIMNSASLGPSTGLPQNAAVSATALTDDAWGGAGLVAIESVGFVPPQTNEGALIT